MNGSHLCLSKAFQWHVSDLKVSRVGLGGSLLESLVSYRQSSYIYTRHNFVQMYHIYKMQKYYKFGCFINFPKIKPDRIY